MPSKATDTRPTRDELAARVRQLEAQVSTPDVSRRGALAALLGAGSMAALSQPAAAQSDEQGAACTWLGDQDAAGYDLFGLSHTFMGTVSDTPADDEYASDEVAVYVKDDDNLYLRPNGGTEQVVSGSSSGALADSGSDTDGGDDYVMPSAADNIDLQNDGGLRNADVVSTDEVFTEPAGALLTQDSDQTISTGSLTALKWDSANEFNAAASSFANLANNQIKVPSSDYSFGVASVGLRMNSAISWKQIRFIVDGSLAGTAGLGRFGPRGLSMRATTYTSGWFPVGSGTTVEVQFEHSAGSDQTTDSTNRDTWLQLWAF